MWMVSCILVSVSPRFLNSDDVKRGDKSIVSKKRSHYLSVRFRTLYCSIDKVSNVVIERRIWRWTDYFRGCCVRVVTDLKSLEPRFYQGFLSKNPLSQASCRMHIEC